MDEREDVPLDRAEAVALLKELIALNMALPSYVTLNENKQNETFTLVLKGECDVKAMNKFIAGKNLAVKEDKEKGTCTIYKP